jgi:nucleoid-associated protein YgaU
MLSRDPVEEALAAEERAAELRAQGEQPEERQAEVTLADELAEMAKSKAKRAGLSARTYVVQAGDTLSGIAASLYGDASRWNEIFEANRATLDDPNMIQVGQVLQIP